MEWDEMEIDEDLAAAAFGSSAAAPAHEAGCGGRRHLLHVVLDTNVMLRIGRARARAGAPAQREPLTEQTMMHAVAEHGAARIVIPWTVLCELEGLKSSASVARDAQSANKVLLDLFEGRRDLIVGQTPAEARKAAVEFSELLSSSPPPGARSNDNRILQCALQLLERAEAVLLVSDDVNMLAKAAIVRLETANAETFVSKLLRRPGTAARPALDKVPAEGGGERRAAAGAATTRGGVDATIDIASTALSEVIKAKFAHDFGSGWESVVGVAKQPARWTRADVLYLARKHWVGILEEALSGRARDSIDICFELDRDHRRRDPSSSEKQIHVDAATGASRQLLDEIVGLLRGGALPFSSEASAAISGAASDLAALLRPEGGPPGGAAAAGPEQGDEDCAMEVD